MSVGTVLGKRACRRRKGGMARSRGDQDSREGERAAARVGLKTLSAFRKKSEPIGAVLRSFRNSLRVKGTQGGGSMFRKG